MSFKTVAILFSVMLLNFTAYANELEAKKIDQRDIIFKSRDKTLRYRNIIGYKDGSFRDLIKINSTPSLYSSADGENYYTLKAEGNEIKVDCLYSDVRNPFNGIRIRKGICGLNQNLNSEYTDSAFNLTDKWQSETSNIDTSLLIERGEPVEVLVSENSEIKISQRYSELSDLENSTPDAIVEVSNSCFNLGKRRLYVVSHKLSHELEAVFIEPHGEEFTIRNLADEIKNIKTSSCSKR
ncbi:hypothetical protein [Pseudomonas oryzihabitans]|uniref:hypothetical protein n=1 Tax=Pseudomonas oryzihabitans TaxID=47885 RepID=UPI000A79B93F|nr:hypothetical protein [Pseudomonas oryzihabitans]